MTTIYGTEGSLPDWGALRSDAGSFSDSTEAGGSYPWPAACPSIPTPDTEPPEVTFVSPVPGSSIGLEDELVVNVTDNLDALERALLVVYIHSTGVQELVFDGTSFTARYVAQSTRVAITNGYQFTLRRTGGWPNNTFVTVRVFAVDDEGNTES